MIRRYSELKQPVYEFPKREDRKNFLTYEAWRDYFHFVSKCQKDLITKKLLPNGGKVPSKNPNKFQIVNKDPIDKSKWRITHFVIEDGKQIPVGHNVANVLLSNDSQYTTAGGSVEEFLFNVDWRKWLNA